MKSGIADCGEDFEQSVSFVLNIITYHVTR